MESLISSLSTHFTPTVQVVLLVVIVFVIRAYFARKRHQKLEEEIVEEVLPPMDKRDFTLEELKPYDGVTNAHILIAVNSKVFDVTRAKGFYGPGGPYNIFAGRDASRGLATFCADNTAIKEEYDDLSDLNSMQMDSVMEWEMQFTEKYEQVGKLLKPGEKHCNYKAEESGDESKNENTKKVN